MNTITQSQALRLAALKLLEHADRLDTKVAYAVTHIHEYGETIMIGRFENEPDTPEAVRVLRLDFEPEKQERLAVHRLFPTELCGLDGENPAIFPMPAKSENVEIPSLMATFKRDKNGVTETLATLHRGPLDVNTFLSIQYAVGVLYQQASAFYGNGMVQINPVDKKTEEAAACL